MTTQEIIASDVLKRLSVHLDHLSSKIFEVEEALGELLNHESKHEGLPITKFQSLDFTRQSLEDCSLLLCFFSQIESFQESSIDDRNLIIEGLKLDITRSLVQPNSSIASLDNTGEVDLF
ncbi:MAG: hypothetical protein AB8B62_13995 [Roseobacter sp.]